MGHFQDLSKLAPVGVVNLNFTHSKCEPMGRLAKHPFVLLLVRDVNFRALNTRSHVPLAARQKLAPILTLVRPD